MLIGQVQGMLDRLASTAGLDPTRGRDAGNERARTGERTSVADPTRSAHLTTKERIRRIVEENDGRVGQGEIVSSLECSAATVSRRLGELEEDGAVVRYRVGRRKIVCLPGEVDLPGRLDRGSDGAGRRASL